MHDDYWEPVEQRLRPAGLVLVNDSTFTSTIRDDVNVVRLRATELANEAGNPLGGAMVMAGAYSALTDLVGLDALVEGMRESIPPYRQQHIATNETVLRLGFEQVDRGAFPAWEVKVTA
jgi:2-oxoglutarate ferredoxin oxidoreductase subunit gamma